jgi:hypothetical protein
MPDPTILGYGVFLIGLLQVAFARSRFQNRSANGNTVATEARARISSDRFPDSTSLAGVPLRILLSDRSGPGALLRDTLMICPTTLDR